MSISYEPTKQEPMHTNDVKKKSEPQGPRGGVNHEELHAVAERPPEFCGS